MNTRHSLLVALLLASVQTSWAALCAPPMTCDGPAELPRQYIDTTFPSLAGYITKTVCSSGCDYSSLQNALNNIAADGGTTQGEIIRLGSGQTFTGNFTLPAYAMAPGKWVIIRSDVPDTSLPPEGTRLTPANAGVLAKIVSTNASPAVQTASRANSYWFMGVEITVPSQTSLNYGVVVIGNSESQVSQLPFNIVFDRCYIHGNDNGEIKRGVDANGVSIAIINSTLDNFHSSTQGNSFDTQAILAYNTPGPLKIVNNFLEGSGENVMFGGATSRLPSPLLPSDIELRFNHFHKRLTWFKNPQMPYVVKNILEFKFGQRALIEGNLFENNWAQAQSGWGIVLTPRGQNGQMPWATITDITFRFNIFRQSGNGINIAAQDSNGASLATERLSMHDNLMEDIAVRWNGTGHLLQILSVPPSKVASRDFWINHNTAFQEGNIMSLSSGANQPFVGLVMNDNIFPYNRYGIHGGGTYSGSLWTALLTNPIFTGNVVEKPYTPQAVAGYPAGNFYPPDWATVQFVNHNSGVGGDYRLAAGSPYKGAATDAATRIAQGLSPDIGADMDALIRYTCLAVSGNPAASCSGLPPSVPPPSQQPNRPALPPPVNAGAAPLPHPRVFPNPWRQDRHASSAITFDQLSAITQIQIFSLSGHLVQEIAVSGTSATWDQHNKSGDRVASGVYFYVASDNAGRSVKGKFAIVK